MQYEKYLTEREVKSVLIDIREIEQKRDILWQRARYTKRTSSKKIRNKLSEYSYLLDDLYGKLEHLTNKLNNIK